MRKLSKYHTPSSDQKEPINLDRYWAIISSCRNQRLWSRRRHPWQRRKSMRSRISRSRTTISWRNHRIWKTITQREDQRYRRGCRQSSWRGELQTTELGIEHQLMPKITWRLQKTYSLLMIMIEAFTRQRIIHEPRIQEVSRRAKKENSAKSMNTVWRGRTNQANNKRTREWTPSIQRRNTGTIFGLWLPIHKPSRQTVDNTPWKMSLRTT